MLSHITWSQFWTVITAVVSVYYIIVALIYFRDELGNLLKGKVNKRTTSNAQQRIIPKGGVIGSFESSDEPIIKQEKTFPYILMENIENNNIINDIAQETNGVTSVSKSFSDEINHALLEEEYLSEEFIARVNAGLEDEQLSGASYSVIAEIPLETGSQMDAEEFFTMIQQGMGEFCVQVVNKELVQEITDHDTSSFRDGVNASSDPEGEGVNKMTYIGKDSSQENPPLLQKRA